MSKIAPLTAALLSIAMITPAFAETNSSVSNSANLSARFNLVCLTAAVDAHQDAVITARTAFNAAILSALQNRKTSLHAALQVTNDQDRTVAIKASVKAYTDAVRTARTTFKTAIQAALKTHATAKAHCRLTTGTGSVALPHREKDKENKSERKEVKSNNGLHLGQLKKALRVKGEVKTDFDATFQSDLND